MEKWTPENLSKQTERATSDAELIKKGAEFVQDENAENPRLHLKDEALDSVNSENERIKIEKGELIKIGKRSLDDVLRMVDVLALERKLNFISSTEGDKANENKYAAVERAIRETEYVFHTEFPQNSAIADMLEQYPSVIVGENLDKRLLVLCRHIKGIDELDSDIYEINNDDAKLLLKDHKGNVVANRGGFTDYMPKIKEALGRIKKVDTLSPEEYTDFVKKMAEEIISKAVIFDKKERANREKQKQSEKDKENKAFDPSI